ncbi:MAG: cytochrome c biogenesis protein CcdA [Candidatus Tantalella remota]|nr:cytochrome c biogenesis protein CcdA [Candidatus Tantalella remota]
MEHVSYGLAFLAGFLSFLSPCILPLVPGYISFLSGASLEELKKGAAPKEVARKAGLTSIFFVLGFSLVFTLLGASATAVGKIMMQYLTILTKIAGALIFILGLHLLGVLKMKWLNYEKRVQLKNISPGYWGAFLVGLAFALGWTPCVGPILAGILALAATQNTVVKGMIMLLLYSLGLGIPFIVTGFAVGVFMKFFEKYKRFIRSGEIVAGIFLIGLGILIFTDNVSMLLRYLPESFYNFAK